MMDKKLLLACVIAFVAANAGCITYTGVVQDKVNVTGSALSPANIAYTIEVAESWNPANWSSLGVSIENSSRQANESVLGLVDTSYLPDGNYSIRLSVTDEFNQTSRDIVFVSVDNVRLTYPGAYDVVARGTQLAVNGTVVGHFTRYTLEYGFGVSPLNYSAEGMTLSGGGTSEVRNGTLGMWNTSSVSSPGLYVIRLVVEYAGGKNNTENVTVIIDVFADGWPKAADAYLMSAPVFADVDGNGAADVIASSAEGKVHAWNASGILLAGWPVNLTETLYYATPIPAVGDVDGDGESEVVVGGVSKMHALKADGSEAPGWPVTVSETITTAPLLYDLDGDRRLETLFGAENKIYALRGDGTALEGWPAQVSKGSYQSFVMLSAGDVEGDGKPEVVASSYYDSVHVYRADGASVSGWPKQPLNMSYLYDVLLADLNADGVFEIIVGADSGKVGAFYGNGSYVPGFPRSVGGQWTSVYPVAADLDGDGRPEILASTSDGVLAAVTANGSNFGERVNGSVTDYALESSHPYLEDFDYTWTVQVPGASSVAVHFGRIDVEYGYDFVYVLDGNGTVVESFTGAQQDVWSKTVPGDTVKIRLVSDYIISEWGFSVDKIVNGSVTKTWPLATGSFPSYPIVGGAGASGGPEILVSYLNGTQYTLASYYTNGSLVEDGSKALKEQVVWSPTVGGVGAGRLHVGASSGRGVYLWAKNASVNLSTMHWPSLHHDVHNSRTYIDPARRIQLVSPAQNASLTAGSIVFAFIPRDVEVTSCSLYSNASGAWAKEYVIGPVAAQQLNNVTLNVSARGLIAWNIRCSNPLGLNVSAPADGLFTALSNLTIANMTFGNVTNVSAVASWTTSYPASYVLDFGTTASYGTRLSSNETATSHTASLTNLSPFTTYRINATVFDAYGRNASTGTLNLTTNLYTTSKLNLSSNSSTGINVTAGQLNLTINVKSNTTKENVTLLVNASHDNPTNTSFALPALGKYLTISIPEAADTLEWLNLEVDYTDAEVAALNLNESSLAFFWLNESAGEWLRLNATSMSWVYGTGVDTEANFVWANVSHTSQYTIAGELLATTSQTTLTTNWNLISIPINI